MEAVCCCVRKLVTSLSLFFLAPLRVSPSLSPSIFFISHLYLSLCLSLTRSLSFSFPLSSLQPSFCPRRHPRLILPESWPSEPDKNSAPVFVQVCVCAFACGGVSVSSSIDEIWAVKYECWVVFWCHTVMSLMHGVVVKNVRVHKHLHAAFIVYDK